MRESAERRGIYGSVKAILYATLKPPTVVMSTPLLSGSHASCALAVRRIQTTGLPA